MLFLASSGEFGLICLRHAIKIKCQQLSSGLQYSLKYTKWLLCQRSFWSRDNSHIRKYTPGCTNSLKYTSPCTNVVFLHVAVAPNIAIVYAATSPHCDRGALENLCSLWVHKMPPSLGIQTTCPLFRWGFSPHCCCSSAKEGISSNVKEKYLETFLEFVL